MTNGAIAATGAAAANEIANAVKASGAIVYVQPPDFEAILQRSETPLVVQAEAGVFTTKYQYVTPYRGLIFYTISPAPLPLPRGAELITARKIWVPG